MVRRVPQADLIVAAITHYPGCCLDDLVKICPELTWNQIFLEVDQLSRAGRLRLSLVGPGRYAVKVSTDAVSRAPKSYEIPVETSTRERHLHDTRCERGDGVMASGTYHELKG